MPHTPPGAPYPLLDEIEPAADPRSRSFVVKVPLPTRDDLYPGMFGRLRVRLTDRPAILVPRDAIRRVGQLTMVLVRSGERWTRRHVRAGQEIDGRVEILAGLRGGDRVGL